MEFTLERGTELLRRAPGTYRSFLDGLPDDWMSAREAPEAWSPWQVLAHVTWIDEHDWIDRTRVILEHGTERPFDPVDREAGFDRFSGRTTEELLDRFAEVRASNLETLGTLVGPEDLSRPGVHPEFGQVTLDQLLATWVVHDLNHLGQVIKTMSKEYAVAVGPWRKFLPIVDLP